MHFSFEKHVPSQVLKDFSVENLETTPRSIYLDLLIIGIVFWYYTQREVHSVWFVLYPYFFSFFLSSYFLFLPVFSLIETNDSWDRWDGRGNHYFSRFPLPPANEYSFNSTRFMLLIFTLSICNYQTDSWWDLFSLAIYILFAFLRMLLSRSGWFWHFKLTVRIWAYIKLSLFYYKANALTQWDLYP